MNTALDKGPRSGRHRAIDLVIPHMNAPIDERPTSVVADAAVPA